jgi:hypothetical protein
MGPRWFVSDGSEVRIGDRVRTDLAPDAHGEVVGTDGGTGLPRVRLLTGDRSGEVVSLWPGQILGRIKRRR